MSTKPATRRRFSRARREPAPPRPADETRGAQRLTTVIAVVGCVIALWGFMLDWFPQLRRDPLTQIGADIQVMAVEPGVTLGAWLQRVYRDRAHEEAAALFGSPPTRDQLRFPGELVYVRTQVDGHKFKDVSLRWRVMSVETQHTVDAPLPKLPRRLHLDAPSQRSVQLLWIPSLEEEPAEFVRVEMHSDRGLLAVADSEILEGGLPAH